MRPKKLILTAFGPFADTQTIDFNELDGRSMFVITGPTGAGKTTIFDGITFALYGDASGESRLSENFKSQYAPIERRCSVELTFLVHQKEYRVTRTPKQIKLGRDGNPRWENASATLILPDSTVVTGTNEVNARIIALLGLSKEQFKKIVMLPQGEFRKLLEEKNDTKQEIFRKIFSTQIFERFTRGLVEQSKELEQKLSLTSAQNRSILQSVDCGEEEELRELIAREIPDLSLILDRLKTKVQTDKTAFLANQGELDRLLKEKDAIPLAQGEELNRKFDQLSHLEQEAKELARQQPEQQERQTLFTRLSGCQKGFLVEQAVVESKNTLHRLSEELASAQEKAASTEQEVQSWTEKSRSLPEWEAQLSALRENRQRFSSLKEQAQKLEESAKELEKLKETQAASEQSEKLLMLYLGFLDKQQQQTQIRQTSAQLEELRNQIRRFYQLVSRQREQRTQYERLFSLFLDQQAGFLAKKLRPNAPCPVCGSTEHPAPAGYEGEPVGEERLNQAKAEFEELTRRLQELDALCRRQIDALREQELWPDFEPEAILSCGDDQWDSTFTAPAKELVQRETRLCEELDGILVSLQGFPSDQVNACRVLDRDAVEQQAEAAGRRSLSLAAEIRVKEEAAKQLLQALKQQGGTSPAELDRQTQELTRKQTELENTLHQVRSELPKAQAGLERYQERIRQLTGFAKQEEQKLSRLREQFKNVLLEAGIQTNEEYRELKQRLSELPGIQEELESFRRRQSLNSELLRSLKQELSGKQRADLNALSQKKQEITRQYDALFEHQLALKTRLEQNASAHRRLLENQKHVQSYEKKYQTVGGLARLANGNNAQRMSFERYVLASYFEDIVSSANLRLSQMTSNRYELRRKEEKERHGKGSGLELEVFDSHTGKLRDVSTLSGGESFKASLSLALGMADIVSSYAGGVEIGTMFIDEGFGTLDPESLDSAVNTLMQLQTGGRLIGIISHVPELKERIDAKLVVIPAKSGSTVHFEFQ